MEIKAKLVKAFSKDKNQGNPAGVILDADLLTEKQMINVSSELGFSESAFIQKSENADYKVRFFTPIQEIGLCGHATIATFHSLIEANNIKFNGLEIKSVTQETKEGILNVSCHKNGFIEMSQNEPKFFDPVHNKKEIVRLLNIDEADIMEYPIQTVSTGVPKLMIPVKSLKILFDIKPDLDGIREYCKKTEAKGFYPFTFETNDEKSDFHARQFNPLAGIDEDPITGMAAGALGAYIVHNKISNKKKFIVEQGYIMNKGGKVIVDISNGIKVGGYAVTFGEKIIEV